jgi:hypothetical protein
MQKTIKRLFALAAFMVAASSQALPIVQADAFTAGDNKAALETNTGLIWMDFGVNSNESYAQVNSKLNTDYLGWRLPTANEVIHLWSGLFGAMPGWFSFPGIGFVGSVNADSEFENIFAILGSGQDATYITTNHQTGETETWKARSGFGVFKFDSGNYGMASMASPYDSIHESEAMYLELHGVDASEWYGTMLVKNAHVPEPSSLLIFGLGLLGLCFTRRRAQ